MIKKLWFKNFYYQFFDCNTDTFIRLSIIKKYQYMKTLIIILFSSFLALSCTHKDENNTKSRSISFTEIGKGALYGSGSEGITQSNLVITNDTDWQNLMNQMNSVNNVSDNFTETNIDFTTYEVIAIFLDVKANGWEVSITNITEDNSNIYVDKIEKEYVNSVITQPFHIVKIPKSNKPVIFN